MANETKVGQLVIDLKIKTEALEKGLETAKQKLQEIEQNNKQVENSNKSLDASYLAMSATAVLALGKIQFIYPSNEFIAKCFRIYWTEYARFWKHYE